MSDKIRVVELFAGVGGFRLGLEGWQGKSATSGYTQLLDSPYSTVWANQWEPGSRTQYAANVYRNRWNDSTLKNHDVFEIANEFPCPIPEHDLLVGGFPCQDYSVANTLKRAGGIEGKKGVLWWAIHNILKNCSAEGRPTKYLFLENVDRLLKSPRGQRGRDFAVMLASLYRLGYAVEWRVINAADYGMPQRRRRIFLLAYHESTELYEEIEELSPTRWFKLHGTFQRAFPVDATLKHGNHILLNHALAYISRCFNKSASDLKSPFFNSGLMVDGIARSAQVMTRRPTDSELAAIALARFLEPDVPKSFWVDEQMVLDPSKGWAFHKGPKSHSRVDKETGFAYKWSEGEMSLFDDLSLPARTIITSEGGNTPSRSKHLIKLNGGYRRLTPKELERVSMFPDDHTKMGLTEDGIQREIPDSKRAFLIGNALVVGIVETVGQSLAEAIKRAQRGASKRAANMTNSYEYD
jgi:DNA (cytosine-5)-methyltransferase 1